MKNHKEKIHFIGIGGIGVSALAQYYFKKGAEVSGSDLASSEITDFLKKSGIKISIGKNRSENLPENADLVIYSPAVTKDNPERKRAKERGIETKSYPEALGGLTKEYFTIAVSGAHGKSTTTSMISLVLIEAGLDPTVVIGTKLKEFGNTNFRMGKSRYLVIEADEWQASFLNYWPQIIVLTNIDREHLDYYKDLNHILRTYKEYVSHLPAEGILVANNDNDNIRKLISKSKLQVKKYSLKQKEAEKIKEILKVPGKHNVYNALAVLELARVLNIPDKITLKALSQYKGAWRRFEEERIKINNSQLIVISDYGHHPTEIKATLEAAREKFKNKKIWCIFQPHQYQRTFYLFSDFVKVFSKAPADKIIITDIYDVAGREKKNIKEKINSHILVQKIKKPSVIYLPKKEIASYIKKNIKDIEVLIIMGAGDIYGLEKDLIKR
jgi:UDP-N-acetylmuramate--alanine ligase